ncbi:hypothetical protein ACFLTZ_05135 [Chloroflexota bacterium]
MSFLKGVVAGYDIGCRMTQALDWRYLRRSTGMRITQQIAYLVDMAKAEALDQLGEQQAAIKLAERYV